MLPNGNGTNSKLLWWILGLIGFLVVAAGTGFFSRFNSMQDRLSMLENTLARQEQRVIQVDELVRLVRQEQVDRTNRFAALGERLVVLENKLSNVESRLTTMTERILAINKRVDDELRPIRHLPQSGEGFYGRKYLLEGIDL